MSVSALLEEWEGRVTIAGRTHYAFSSRLAKQGRLADGGIVAVTIFAAATAFSTPFTAELNGIIAGMLAAAGAVGTLLASVWNPSGRSAQHRETAALYFALRRDLELHRLFGEGEARDEIKVLMSRYSDLSRSAPLPPQRLYEKMRKSFHSESQASASSQILAGPARN